MSNQYLAEGVCTLPGGLMWEDRWLGEAELQPLTGYEEDWLAQHPGAPSALAVTKLLSACLVRLDEVPASREMASRLLCGDRDYLMVQLRRLTFGETFSAVVGCPACGAKMDIDFRADEVPVTCHPQTTLIYEVTLTNGDGASRTVRFRLPTGADQEAVVDLPLEQASEILLARCLEDHSDAPLTPDEQASVSEAMEHLAPALDLELDLVCPECQQAFVAPFDTTTFFLRELRMSHQQLLREIHLLALYYHWSEAEILRLTRARRRTYLALLSDATRQE